jgi:hypothetical protein
MICCTLAGMAAAAAGWRRGGRVIASIGMAAFVIFTGVHLQHYGARAEAHHRTLIAEILAAPICAGAPTAAARER